MYNNWLSGSERADQTFGGGGVGEGAQLYNYQNVFFIIHKSKYADYSGGEPFIWSGPGHRRPLPRSVPVGEKYLFLFVLKIINIKCS